VSANIPDRYENAFVRLLLKFSALATTGKFSKDPLEIRQLTTVPDDQTDDIHALALMRTALLKSQNAAFIPCIRTCKCPEWGATAGDRLEMKKTGPFTIAELTIAEKPELVMEPSVLK
jgi:hypothetical protein